MKDKTICEIIPRVRERVERDGVDSGTFGYLWLESRQLNWRY